MKRANVIGPPDSISVRIASRSELSSPCLSADGVTSSRRHSMLIEPAPSGWLIEPTAAVAADGRRDRRIRVTLRRGAADVAPLVGGGRHYRLAAVAEDDRATDRIRVDLDQR